mmetsp:Transcript_18498/g.28220  ORF Transcript_18498/g.28220 Transcript_18498/m.28220 type:complete len:371 (+) Transcript_18498:1995-3107(+)
MQCFHLLVDSFTTLELDDSFDPSSEAAQEYMLEFCDRLFAEDFASKTFSDYECPMDKFNKWLQEQSSSTSPDMIYSDFCAGATEIPIRQEFFDRCIISWSKSVIETDVLSNDGEVKIILIRAQSRARFDSAYDLLKTEWNKFETWLKNERKTAPEGVNRMYHSSEDFWWYDTNGQMLATAYTGAAIALACAAVVVFFSSRSLIMTLFAILSIGYVLVATSACLVAIGWELGFLESVCFAILIGISCDFVIHFGHAYTHQKGEFSRHDRTEHALRTMGPSILAAAVTTISAAIIMFFTEITFFQKFATILFLTIVHSTLGSFVVFITLADCLGPSNPTQAYDAIVGRLFPKKKNEDHPTAGVTKDIDELEE